MAGEPGTLYLCATPIGNLEDISARALRILREVDLIAAEDTRTSRQLLLHFDIHTPLTAYHDHNRYEKAEELTEQLLAGKNIAVVTDAGTPAISDPGEEFVACAVRAGVPVVSVPGPVAAVTALTVSGLSARRFCFEGFLPRNKKERRQILEELALESRTILLHEAPHRLRETLAELTGVFGANRAMAVCRELTKLHEEVLRGTIEELQAHFAATEPRGEFVLVIEGRGLTAAKEEEQAAWRALPVQEHMERYLAKGLSEKDAMKQVARDRGVGKREIYTQVKSGKENDL